MPSERPWEETRISIGACENLAENALKTSLAVANSPEDRGLGRDAFEQGKRWGVYREGGGAEGAWGIGGEPTRWSWFVGGEG
eukprot:CAMPEP_0174299150 /NCGR_PEP_ID=MMETSP0809-20121228/55857_1 /TAXON_ID=73025 ORGANISM="Eutreptiella gymnastica-like, Strain CCMP1594" /NCGR_SAMPLE_ID=MMETSP0809 /ASSEMBLY_ACC=CAM_ASM_000658 /LENGTH=81 /DNA_ID=CAMNT_0015404129 /DNA_START=518 /DNA_END=760 /DNA_ORIENTATION=-